MKITRWNLMAGVAIATSVAVLTACAPSSSSTTTSAGKKSTLSLVAYSVPKAADGALDQAFAKTDPGKDVTWKQSYGASGDQSRAVVGGLTRGAHAIGSAGRRGRKKDDETGVPALDPSLDPDDLGDD